MVQLLRGCGLHLISCSGNFRLESAVPEQRTHRVWTWSLKDPGEYGQRGTHIIQTVCTTEKNKEAIVGVGERSCRR
jgi:hypothetical protein